MPIEDDDNLQFVLYNSLQCMHLYIEYESHEKMLMLET